MRLLRRRGEDPRLTAARAAHAGGDFWTARELAAEIVAGAGLVSHGFLRRYAWTLDFDAMAMSLALPD